MMSSPDTTTPEAVAAVPATKRMNPYLAGGMGWRGMLEVHRDVKWILEDHSAIKRVELTVRSGFEPGLRWARMLGFEHEGKMKSWAPDGHDYDLFARIR